MITTKDAPIHASGHGYAEEIKLMLNLTKPRYVMPFHGDHKRIQLHGDLAQAVGIERECIFSGENGLPLEVDGRGARFGTRERSGMIYVDGVDIGDPADVALRDRRVIASTDPLPKNSVVRLQATDAFLGRGWVGEDEATGAVLAMAPILNEVSGQTDGVVAVGRQFPSLLDNLREAVPNLLTYLGIASLLGVLGSLLLARTVKRQTLGLEPREITGLVEQRDADADGLLPEALHRDAARHRIRLGQRLVRPDARLAQPVARLQSLAQVIRGIGGVRGRLLADEQRLHAAQARRRRLGGDAVGQVPGRRATNCS